MSFRLVCVALLAALLLGFTVVTSADAPAPPEKIRVLFEVGGNTAHKYDEPPESMKKFLEATGDFEVTITQDRDLFKAENIRKFHLVMLYTTRGDLSEAQLKGLTDFVAKGGGLVGIHSSTAMCLKSDEFWKLLGARFIAHGRATFTSKITGKSHSIMQGMTDITLNEETYRHKFCPDSKLITLMRRDTDSEPVTWIQYYGEGRVFNTALGHDMKTWGNADFQKLVLRGSLWAAKRINP